MLQDFIWIKDSSVNEATYRSSSRIWEQFQGIFLFLRLPCPHLVYPPGPRKQLRLPCQEKMVLSDAVQLLF
uniref:Uncharacterized protein n=1 Tax=Sphaerodactylus townsendi TaxID=933632 RepID=A0ACB8EGE0_9SAUR